MKKRLTLLYISIIVLPVAALVFFGTRAATGEVMRWNQARENLYHDKLDILSRNINGSLLVMEKEMRKHENFMELSIPELREVAYREIPFCRQVFIMDPDGRFFYPPEEGRSEGESAFFRRTSELWKKGINFLYPDENGGVKPHGWFTYYEGNSISYIFWIRNPDGKVLGFDIYREYLIDEVLYSLPAPAPDEKDFYSERIILKDELGKPIYISGGYAADDDLPPRVTFNFAEPFGGWRLEARYLQERSNGLKAALPLLLTMTALGLALIGAVILLWRESFREIRDARTKVTFVNQVSHELKTPLTNIRMYSEMLESLLKEESREKHYASVLTRESDRLSRMIQNVLSFSREKIRLRFKEDNPDIVIGSVLEATAPRLEEKKMEVDFIPEAPGPFYFDTDCLEQIIWNLISNGEKYAASGRYLGLRSRITGNILEITVKDRGPGIPHGQRESIFKPFFRARNDITEGVSGTGLGLSISRDLARKHGGDLVLADSGSEQGAVFILTLKSGAAL